MHSLNDTALESNKYMKINFDRGDLSSDAGLLPVKEFACKLGFDKTVIGKEALASQPTLSRFFNRMDDSTLRQFHNIMRRLRRVVYDVKKPPMILLCWIWIPHYLTLTAIRKGKVLTSIIRAMDIIRLSVMTG